MSYDPTWVEVLKAAVASGLSGVHTCLPGSVLNYDPETQTAKVQIMLSEFDSPIAPLEGVPVRFPRFGNFRIVGPVPPGQEVDLHFYEIDPSRWEETGKISQPNILRRHGLFAFAVLGAASKPNALPATPDDLRLGLADGTIDIVITPEAILLGDATATDFVSTALKVAAALAALKAAVDAAEIVETGASGLGGMAALKAALDTATWPTAFSTAATKVKAI
jgi:hypothetical protein